MYRMYLLIQSLAAVREIGFDFAIVSSQVQPYQAELAN